MRWQNVAWKRKWNLYFVTICKGDACSVESFYKLIISSLQWRAHVISLPEYSVSAWCLSVLMPAAEANNLFHQLYRNIRWKRLKSWSVLLSPLYDVPEVWSSPQEKRIFTFHRNTYRTAPGVLKELSRNHCQLQQYQSCHDNTSSVTIPANDKFHWFNIIGIKQRQTSRRRKIREYLVRLGQKA